MAVSPHQKKGDVFDRFLAEIVFKHKIDPQILDSRRFVNVSPQIEMNPKPILGLPDFEINSGSPHTDSGIPVLVWGPRVECRSNLGMKA